MVAGGTVVVGAALVWGARGGVVVTGVVIGGVVAGTVVRGVEVVVVVDAGAVVVTGGTVVGGAVVGAAVVGAAVVAGEVVAGAVVVGWGSVGFAPHAVRQMSRPSRTAPGSRLIDFAPSWSGCASTSRVTAADGNHVEGYPSFGRRGSTIGSFGSVQLIAASQ